MEKLIRSEKTLYFAIAVLALMLWDSISNILFLLLSLYVGFVIVDSLVKVIRKVLFKWILPKY